MKKKRPYSFSIVPNYIKPDKRLSPMAKLLFGEIVSLAENKGHCFASNAYFQKMYVTSKSTVSQSISKLEEFDYISCEFDSRHNRKIYVVEKPTIVENEYAKSDPMLDSEDTLDEELSDLSLNSNSSIVDSKYYNRSTKEEELDKEDIKHHDDHKIVFETEEECYNHLIQIFSKLYPEYRYFHIAMIKDHFSEAIKTAKKKRILQLGLEKWVLSVISPKDFSDTGFDYTDKKEFVSLAKTYSSKLFSILSL